MLQIVTTTISIITTIHTLYTVKDTPFIKNLIKRYSNYKNSGMYINEDILIYNIKKNIEELDNADITLHKFEDIEAPNLNK